jgi:hypothetical protein
MRTISIRLWLFVLASSIAICQPVSASDALNVVGSDIYESNSTHITQQTSPCVLTDQVKQGKTKQICIYECRKWRGSLTIGAQGNCPPKIKKSRLEPRG